MMKFHHVAWPYMETSPGSWFLSTCLWFLCIIRIFNLSLWKVLVTFVLHCQWSKLICLGFECLTRRSKGLHLDGAYLLKIQANFGQSHSGLSLLEVVISKAFISPCTYTWTCAMFARIQSHTYLNPTLKSSMFRLITAFPVAGQSCCADLKWKRCISKQF